MTKKAASPATRRRTRVGEAVAPAPHQADSKSYARNLHAVDIAGAGATMAGVNRIPTHLPVTKGEVEAPSLLDLYKRWSASELRKKLAAGVAAPDTESHALRKSVNRVGKRLDEGWEQNTALFTGHRKYSKLGGHLDYQAWLQRVAAR